MVTIRIVLINVSVTDSFVTKAKSRNQDINNTKKFSTTTSYYLAQRDLAYLEPPALTQDKYPSTLHLTAERIGAGWVYYSFESVWWIPCSLYKYKNRQESSDANGAKEKVFYHSLFLYYSLESTFS